MIKDNDNNLVWLRGHFKLSQKDIAEICGKSESVIKHYETKESDIKLDVAKIICSHLKCDLSDIYNYSIYKHQIRFFEDVSFDGSNITMKISKNYLYPMINNTKYDLSDLIKRIIVDDSGNNKKEKIVIPVDKFTFFFDDRLNGNDEDLLSLKQNYNDVHKIFDSYLGKKLTGDRYNISSDISVDDCDPDDSQLNNKTLDELNSIYGISKNDIFNHRPKYNNVHKANLYEVFYIDEKILYVKIPMLYWIYLHEKHRIENPVEHESKKLIDEKLISFCNSKLIKKDVTDKYFMRAAISITPSKILKLPKMNRESNKPQSKSQILKSLA